MMSKNKCICSILHINLFNNPEVCFQIVQPIRTSLAYVLYKTSILRITTINLFPNTEFCVRMVQPTRTNLAFCQLGRTEIRCRISHGLLQKSVDKLNEDTLIFRIIHNTPT